MKKVFICSVLALVCAWFATVAQAETVVLVGSTKSAEMLLEKLDDVAGLTERDDFKSGIGVMKFMASKDGPVGMIVDTARPAGIVAFLKDCDGQCKGCPVAGVVALPIRDWDKLGKFIDSKDVELEEAGDNLWKLAAPGGKVFYGKKSGGWLLATDKKEHFPKDVDFEKFIVENTERVDVGFTVFAANVPDEYKDKAVKEIAKLIKKCAKKHLRGKEPSEAAITAFKKALEDLKGGLKDLDRITYGHFWNMDADEYSLSVTITGKEGSKLAKKLAGIAAVRKTNFAGFRCEEATLVLAKNGIVKPISKDLMQEHFALCGEKVEKRIREKAGDEADGAVAFFKKNQELIKEALLEGNIDSVLAAKIAADNVVFSAARYTPDGYAWEEQFKKVIAFAKEKKGDKCKKCVLKSGTKTEGEFHAYWAALKLPKKLKGGCREAVVQALGGEEIPVVVVFAPKAVYLAAGKNAGEMLKSCIEASKEPKELPTFYAQLSLVDLAKAAADCGKDYPAKNKVKKAVERMGDVGRGMLTVQPYPVENGVQVRFRASTSAIKMLKGI